MPSPKHAVSLVALLLVALATACSADDDGGSGLGSGTEPEDGKFVAPPTKPEDGQKGTNTGAGTGASKAPPPASSAPPAPGTKPNNADASCAAPQCTGVAGLCGCRGGSAGKQTIMGCSNGKCFCAGKTFADDGACGPQADAAKLKTLFATCGCQ